MVDDPQEKDPLTGLEKPPLFDIEVKEAVLRTNSAMAIGAKFGVGFVGGMVLGDGTRQAFLPT